MQYNKILFVSTSDTCRGPWAAGIMKKLDVTGEFKGVVIESRGLVSLFSEPVNPKAAAVAKSNDIDIFEYTSVQLSSMDLSTDTLVLVMSEAMKKKIYEEYLGAENVYTIKEFVGEQGDIEEPYGKELTEYGSYFDEMQRIIKKVREKFI